LQVTKQVISGTSPSRQSIVLVLTIKRKETKCRKHLTSGFDFDLFNVIGIWFCTGLPNFMQIGWSPTDLWHHIHLTRWRP